MVLLERLLEFMLPLLGLCNRSYANTAPNGLNWMRTALHAAGCRPVDIFVGRVIPSGLRYGKLNVPRSNVLTVTQFDHSAWVYTVHRDNDPRCYALLIGVNARTDSPVLVKRSSNAHGEPIRYMSREEAAVSWRPRSTHSWPAKFLVRSEDQDFASGLVCGMGLTSTERVGLQVQVFPVARRKQQVFFLCFGSPLRIPSLPPIARSLAAHRKS